MTKEINNSSDVYRHRLLDKITELEREVEAQKEHIAWLQHEVRKYREQQRGHNGE